MSNSLIFTGLGLTLMVAAGCASSVGAVRGAVDAAPDWYEASRNEIRGQGYPDISRVSGYAVDEESTVRLTEGRDAVKLAGDRFALDAIMVPPPIDLEEVEAWIAAAQAEFAQLPEEGEFLTDVEIAQLRAVFAVPRAAS